MSQSNLNFLKLDKQIIFSTIFTKKKKKIHNRNYIITSVNKIDIQYSAKHELRSKNKNCNK